MEALKPDHLTPLSIHEFKFEFAGETLRWLGEFQGRRWPLWASAMRRCQALRRTIPLSPRLSQSFHECVNAERLPGNYLTLSHLQWSGHLAANARALGGMQRDALQNMTGKIRARSAIGSTGPIVGADGVFAYTTKSEAINAAPVAFDSSITNGDAVTFDMSRVARTSSETRASNTAFHPRIQI